MAVVRPELQLNETEEILELIARARPPRRSPLWLAQRELRRSLDLARATEAAQVAELRRIKARRLDPDANPLIPAGMLGDRRPETAA